jgi:hypothetical protein
MLKYGENHNTNITAEDLEKGKVMLQKYIDKKIESARSTYRRVMEEIPTDKLPKGSAMVFGPQGVVIDGGRLQIHTHARTQLAEKAHVPSAYLNELAAGEPWQRELGAHILNEHYHQAASDTRFLTREVDGQLRGVLSPAFRRLDNRPLLETFAAEVEKNGLQMAEGVANDVRVCMRAVIPQVFMPVPGELLALGLEWSNSDYGCGKNAIKILITRLWCLNGATMENVLAQIHLGRRLDAGGGITFMQDTYAADTQASRLAMRDTIAGVLGPAKVDEYLAAIKGAAEKKIEWATIARGPGRRLLKGELDLARKAFESEDVINLPAGNNAWRASNAFSWLANGEEVTAERKLVLQAVAGEVLGAKTETVEAEAV